MPVINRETGQAATEQDQKAIDHRAREILSSPYSSPEQIQWALECASPDVGELWFWESIREKSIRKMRAQRLAREA